ncbi:hypothetical protein AB0D12_16640 [Streptomyces sp. NPDC048479]|uniref:hypothetical protein n=1 Tax=Streptomyces sp. NPDC048479 TaxID=3154725 RepID=UPI0034471354
MKFVKAHWDPDPLGFSLDPSPYLAELPKIREALPVDAREFAFDPGHYSMRSSRCVKDLELAGVHVPTDKNGVLTLEFAPNQWKHDSGLRIRYSGVSHFSIEYEGSIDWMQADTVLLDEILPDGHGCVHETALTDASIIIRSRDLRAVWDDAESLGKV